MLKKMLAAAMSIAMAVSLAACSGGSSASATKTEAAKTEAAAEAAKDGGETAAASTVTWPKNVEIIVPAGAGGDTDFNSRLLAQKLTEKLPANFVVSNVTGNGGATGTRKVRDAKNDGSTVLFYHSAFLVNKASKTTDYGFDAYSFACIAAMNRGNVVTVRTDLGINTLEDLYNYTQANPGKLKMAAQTGATSYAIAMQMKAAGFDMNVVDAGSAADRLAAIVGGHVDVILATYGSIKDYITEGTLTPLAMDGEYDLEEESLGIDIKAIHNLGYDSIRLPFYYFFAFPKGTDEAMIKEFNAAVKDIVENDAEYQQKIFDSYIQKPFFQDTEEGLKTFAEVEALLDKVDLTGKVSE